MRAGCVGSNSLIGRSFSAARSSARFTPLAMVNVMPDQRRRRAAGCVLPIPPSNVVGEVRADRRRRFALPQQAEAEEDVEEAAWAGEAVP